MRQHEPRPVRNALRSRALVTWCQATLAARPDHPFACAQAVARRLGAWVRRSGDEQWVEFGLWAPEIDVRSPAPSDIWLELLEPIGVLDLGSGHQEVELRRTLLPVNRVGHFVWVAADNVTVGTRESCGAFYRLRMRDRDGTLSKVADHLAWSLPYGPFAPAEVYDVTALDAGRGDREWFAAYPTDADGHGIIGPPSNILEVHVPTATLGGTIASLTRRVRALAEKLEHDLPLAAEDEVLLSYDAWQLMPVQPTIVFEAGPPFWSEPDEAYERPSLPEVERVTLTRPATQNWGYDTVISGSSAINPALLESGRPDEMVDLATALHTFPGQPIKLILDVVFGHADNQCLEVLNETSVIGPNMYGQDLHFRDPVVRAVLLEMQRRQVALCGADGVRVDGAQDFKWWDSERRELRHDDAYLREMGQVVQEVAGVAYRPWMIFEDGRPWPRDDWELASDYRAVIEDQGEHVFQWGPLTFAHNTPFLYTFWIAKWWRILEIAHHGASWISGCANHDTVRRGTQVSPRVNINHGLGGTLLDILDHAYDNAAANLFTYGLLPGVPMDFLNASMRASWGFMRNTDDRYGVKIVAEEASFLDWQVDAISFNKSWHFRRMKDLGFESLEQLRRWMLVLETGVEATGYDLEAIVDIMSVESLDLAGPRELDVQTLKEVARDFMEDVHDYCNVSWYVHDLDPRRVAFNRRLRELRREHPWLRGNLRDDEHLDRRWPAHRSVVFYGLRRAPEPGGTELLMVVNMQGQAVTLTPSELPIPGRAPDGWSLLLATPHTAETAFDAPATLGDSEGLLYIRDAGAPGAR